MYKIAVVNRLMVKPTQIDSSVVPSRNNTKPAENMIRGQSDGVKTKNGKNINIIPVTRKMSPVLFFIQ